MTRQNWADSRNALVAGAIIVMILPSTPLLKGWLVGCAAVYLLVDLAIPPTDNGVESQLFVTRLGSSLRENLLVATTCVGIGVSLVVAAELGLRASGSLISEETVRSSEEFLLAFVQLSATLLAPRVLILLLCAFALLAIFYPCGDLLARYLAWRDRFGKTLVVLLTVSSFSFFGTLATVSATERWVADVRLELDNESEALREALDKAVAAAVLEHTLTLAEPQAWGDFRAAMDPDGPSRTGQDRDETSGRGPDGDGPNRGGPDLRDSYLEEFKLEWTRLGGFTYGLERTVRRVAQNTAQGVYVKNAAPTTTADKSTFADRWTVPDWTTVADQRANIRRETAEIVAARSAVENASALIAEAIEMIVHGVVPVVPAGPAAHYFDAFIKAAANALSDTYYPAILRNVAAIRLWAQLNVTKPRRDVTPFLLGAPIAIVTRAPGTGTYTRPQKAMRELRRYLAKRDFQSEQRSINARRMRAPPRTVPR